MEPLIEKAADLIASGQTSDEIAAALKVSIPTVREWRHHSDVRAYVARREAKSAEKLHDTIGKIMAEMQRTRHEAIRVLTELGATAERPASCRRRKSRVKTGQNRTKADIFPRCERT